MNVRTNVDWSAVDRRDTDVRFLAAALANLRGADQPDLLAADANKLADALERARAARMQRAAEATTGLGGRDGPGLLDLPR